VGQPNVLHAALRMTPGRAPVREGLRFTEGVAFESSAKRTSKRLSLAHPSRSVPPYRKRPYRQRHAQVIPTGGGNAQRCGGRLTWLSVFSAGSWSRPPLIARGDAKQSRIAADSFFPKRFQAVMIPQSLSLTAHILFLWIASLAYLLAQQPVPPPGRAHPSLRANLPVSWRGNLKAGS
jgi:hypothetical protein